MDTLAIEIIGLKNYLGSQWVHSDVNLSVKRGEIFAIIGGSGSGKTVPQIWVSSLKANDRATDERRIEKDDHEIVDEVVGE